ncbi:MAG: UDP-N-acetylglucosamine 4,6-dehydratase (inverting) [Candidatus Magasanikbacteria bacterium]|nr:UDP-N-acetylglucosamine 4,6-dehydratase (inverting) [Candidatus Magasanikbacteria bacterium]
MPTYDFFAESSVLVTGGTGSFGQTFVRRLLTESKARRVIVFSRDELKQLQMRAVIPDPEERLRFFIGDVRERDRLQRAFHGVDFVVHAAALKQVPALEYNPFEAVKTNILGTQNVVEAAVDQGVKKVVFVSTDKAANPANLYGATKLCAEKLCLSGNAYGARKTLFSVVRYGNVIGSRGSLVHLIRERRSSGEIPLTHEEMSRFWITLDQGVNLVLLALERMRGAEIFVPKIPSMRVKDVIKVMAPECRIKVVGIRPGEKMHEVLVTPEEARRTKEYDTYFAILPEYEWWGKEHYLDGKSLPDGFVYSSNTNSQQLDPAGLQAFLSTV